MSNIVILQTIIWLPYYYICLYKHLLYYCRRSQKWSIKETSRFKINLLSVLFEIWSSSFPILLSYSTVRARPASKDWDQSRKAIKKPFVSIQLAASHTQPKCCLLYFNPSPLSTKMLLGLQQGHQLKKAEWVFSTHLLRCYQPLLVLVMKWTYNEGQYFLSGGIIRSILIKLLIIMMLPLSFQLFIDIVHCACLNAFKWRYHSIK